MLQSKGPFLVAFSVLWGLRARLRLALWGLRGGPLSGAPWKVGWWAHQFLTCFLILRTEGLGTNRKMDATNFPSGSLKKTLQLGTEMAPTSGDSIVNNPQKETEGKSHSDSKRAILLHSQLASPPHKMRVTKPVGRSAVTTDALHQPPGPAVSTGQSQRPLLPFLG